MQRVYFLIGILLIASFSYAHEEDLRGEDFDLEALPTALEKANNSEELEMPVI